MGRQKHQPERTCIVCRKARPKRELIRIVRTPAGVRIDPTGKMNGRGAYLCPDPACWQLDIVVPKLQRALRVALTPAEKAMIAAYAQALSEKSAAIEEQGSVDVNMNV